MSITPSPDASATHLAYVFYLNTPTKSSGRLSTGRPIPPTPRKMMTRPRLPRDERRRSLVSAIPRPSSGSSRRASPSYLQDKPLPKLPRSESMLPYSQRPQDDLSGLRQQLPVRGYMNKTITSPTKLTQPLSVPTPVRIPKSATTTSLASRLKARKPTPSRRLLGPVGPPLSRTLSTNNISSQRGEPEVSITDAIHESRMTQSEINLLNQVQKEAAQNHNRLRARYGPQLSPGSVCSDGGNHARSDLKSRTQPAVSLVVDADLANASDGKNVESADAVARSSHDGAMEQETIDPKHVYFEQDVSYWAGRYMTICDRLRTEGLEFSLKTGSLTPTSPDSDSHLSYEAQERRRMLTALYELRSCCKTGKARCSFEQFEQSLKQNMAVSGSTSAQGLSDPENHGAIVQARARVNRNIDRLKTSEGNTAASGVVAPVTAQRSRPSLPLPNIWERLSLTKSKTTSNLADISREPATTAGQRNHPARPVVNWHHRRTSSTQSIAQNIPAAILEEQNESSDFRTPRVPASHRRQSSNVTMSTMSSTQAGSTWEVEGPRRPPKCHCRTSSGSFGRFDEIYPGVTVASIESGHAPAPQPPPPKAKSLPSSKIPGPSVDGERSIKSRREKHRRSSGEAMKDLWQAGVDQVKKMGKRVGGSGSWGGSNEDFDAMVSGGRR